MKAAFLDRDGTIIEDYPDEVWPGISEPVFLNNSIKGLKEILDRDYNIIIITNQYLINKGLISVNQYFDFTNKMLDKLNKFNIDILDIFYCPHTKEEQCDCMKPETGLIDQALNKYPLINLEQSFLAGDSLCDIELGNNIGKLCY